MRQFCTHLVFGLEYLVNRRGSGEEYYSEHSNINNINMMREDNGMMNVVDRI